MTDDLSALKDDMNAFIVGHGLGCFKAYVTEDIESIVWDASPNPDAWKDFVELAKRANVAFLTVSDSTLEEDDIEFLLEDLANLHDNAKDEIEEALWLRSHVNKVGFIQLGFSYNGIMFLYEVSTPWYDRYQQLLDSAGDFGGILLDDRTSGDLDDDR